MRYLMTFSYDGSNYFGYQKQKRQKTIQEEIEKVLSKISNEKITISSSGRTDAKVHAINQKAHFDSKRDLSLEKIKKSMNKMLPNDIYIKSIDRVFDDFHARFDVKKKKYIYVINTGEYSPFMNQYIYQYNKNINIKNMQKALKYLKGTHNFKSFTKTTNEEKNYIRTIYKAEIKKKKDIIIISFIGNGFLRYMIRNMIGVLLAVNEDKIKPRDILKIIELENRKYAYKTAPPEGLYLYDVYY